MRALAFAWRSLLRRGGRSALGIVGIAAAGALMFDMLLLSRGLLVSVRELLDAFGFDVRVLASEGIPQSRLPIEHALETARALSALPEVASAVPFRIGEAEVAAESERPDEVALFAVGATTRRIWTVVDGRDLSGREDDALDVVVNRRLAERMNAGPGTSLELRGRCSATPSILPPVTVRIAGVATFPFDSGAQLTMASRFEVLDRLCERPVGEADLIMVASRPESGPDAAVDAIRKARPDLYTFSNDEVIERFERVGFSYFRQISTALAIVTLSFGIVLITVLLTVSVNQRLGEIAALRAIGFSRHRMAADVLWESALLVGIGGLAAIPLGMALSIWLDAILRSLPGVPATLHFFVFEPRVLWLYAGLLTGVALGAAIYPMWLVTRLPIAGTLRREFVS
ncbi:MAG TPA: FtsX-like permease family protein [Vicinamibacterales bacterium]|nr:FtsX-like permease family protein [Vicinamibacterales bacterium]